MFIMLNKILAFYTLSCSFAACLPVGHVLRGALWVYLVMGLSLHTPRRTYITGCPLVIPYHTISLPAEHVLRGAPLDSYLMTGPQPPPCGTAFDTDGHRCRLSQEVPHVSPLPGFPPPSAPIFSRHCGS